MHAREVEAAVGKREVRGEDHVAGADLAAAGPDDARLAVVTLSARVRSKIRPPPSTSAAASAAVKRTGWNSAWWGTRIAPAVGNGSGTSETNEASRPAAAAASTSASISGRSSAEAA